MKKHFKNLELIICSIYIAILMVVTSIIGIISSIYFNTYGFSFALNIFGLILFAPTLYSYYVKKSIDEFGQDLKDK